jgi:hypothetical protein
MATSITDPGTLEPTDPTDPTYCPTCLSGTAPRDPYFDAAIDADAGTA